MDPEIETAASVGNEEQSQTPIFRSLGVEQEIEEFVNGRKPSAQAEEVNDKQVVVADKSVVDNNNKSNSKPTGETKVDHPIDPKPAVKPAKISDFSKVLPGAKNLTTVVGEEGKKEEQVNTDDKQQQQADNGKPQRDLTGFSEREAKWLQRMPYEAYEYFSKEIKEKRINDTKVGELTTKYQNEINELKKGKVTIPDSYYENPQAAWLQPEVQEIQAGLNLATSIENHWKQQLINIESGKEWFDLIEDPKTGSIYVDNKPKSSGEIGSAEWAAHKTNVAGYFQQSINQSSSVRKELNDYVGSFQNKHKEVLSKIKTAEDSFMPMFKDENSEEYKKLEPIKAEFSKLGISKTNPALNILAKSVALNMIMRDIIMASKTKQETAAAIKEDQRKAGPAGTAFGSGGSVSSGPPAISLKDFAKLGLRGI